MKIISFFLLALSVPALALAVETAPATLTLAEAHALALRNHPQVAIAKLRELVANEALKQNQASYYPTADAYGDAVAAGNRDTRILAGSLSNSAIYDRVADGVSISELITDFGRTKNLVASARIAAKAAGENAAAENEQILLNVDINYFNVLQTAAVLQVAQDTVKARQLLVDQVSALAKNQLRSELDVSFSEVALEQAQLLLQRAEGDAEGAQASLSAALGFREAHTFQLAEMPRAPATPLPVDTLIDTALGNRPDLLRLSYERDAARRFAQAQKDRNYPTLSAVGDIGNAVSHDYRLPDKYAAGGITLDIPLFAGGAYLAQQRQAELEAQIADQALRDQEDNVSRDVRLAWLNFNTSVQRYRTTERLLTHANEAYGLAQARYKIGSSSIVELNDAQVNATSAQITEANARYDELIQQAILNYQTGVLRP